MRKLAEGRGGGKEGEARTRVFVVVSLWKISKLKLFASSKGRSARGGAEGRTTDRGWTRGREKLSVNHPSFSLFVLSLFSTPSSVARSWLVANEGRSSLADLPRSSMLSLSWRIQKVRLVNSYEANTPFCDIIIAISSDSLFVGASWVINSSFIFSPLITEPRVATKETCHA